MDLGKTLQRKREKNGAPLQLTEPFHSPYTLSATKRHRFLLLQSCPGPPGPPTSQRAASLTSSEQDDVFVANSPSKCKRPKSPKMSSNMTIFARNHHKMIN